MTEKENTQIINDGSVPGTGNGMNRCVKKNGLTTKLVTVPVPASMSHYLTESETETLIRIRLPVLLYAHKIRQTFYKNFKTFELVLIDLFLYGFLLQEDFLNADPCGSRSATLH